MQPNHKRITRKCSEDSGSDSANLFCKEFQAGQKNILFMTRETKSKICEGWGGVALLDSNIFV